MSKISIKTLKIHHKVFFVVFKNTYTQLKIFKRSTTGVFAHQNTTSKEIKVNDYDKYTEKHKPLIK